MLYTLAYTILSGLDGTDWSDAFMSRPLAPPPPPHAQRCQKYSAHSSAEIRLAGEDIHLVTMAEKMQPVLLVTAHPAKKARKRKPEAGKAATKKALDKERSPTKSISVLRLSGGDNWGM